MCDVAAQSWWWWLDELEMVMVAEFYELQGVAWQMWLALVPEWQVCATKRGETICLCISVPTTWLPPLNLMPLDDKWSCSAWGCAGRSCAHSRWIFLGLPNNVSLGIEPVMLLAGGWGKGRSMMTQRLDLSFFGLVRRGCVWHHGTKGGWSKGPNIAPLANSFVAYPTISVRWLLAEVWLADAWG